MRSFKILDRRTGNRLASIALILGTLVPSLVPALASAAVVSSRSLTLSSSLAGDTDETYRVQFTIPASGGSSAAAFILDFCSNSPVVGQTCTAPGGLSTTSVDTSTAATAASSLAASTVKVVPTSSYSAGDSVDVTLTHIDNPSASGPLYARVITYDTEAHAALSNYTTTALGTGAEDNGGIAAYITSDIGVNAAVRETLTFCVASASITTDCANASSNLPNLELGEGSAGAKALDASHLSTVDLYTLLSTNAASGAVVKLRNNVSCGGLKRVGASDCDIKPADGTTVTNVVQGTPSFGIKADASSGSAVSGSGGTSGNLVPTNSYNTSTYLMHYASDNTSGVTSTYGDNLLNTGGVPVNNEQLQMTLGASVSNVTPAGLYKASLNMIATGTY
jgi:hypothetical protein